MDFRRKTAFFSRLAVLFRLHVNDAESRTENDYKLVWLKRSRPKMTSMRVMWNPSFLKDFHLSEFLGVPIMNEGSTATYKMGSKV